jgi:hypothetical protein
MPASRFCSCDFSFCIDTTMPVGRWVMRTAGVGRVDRLPPGPDERNTSICRSFGLMSISSGSSTSGKTSTPVVDVWMRPCDSVAGTRCTRCTPPSYFSEAQTPCAGSVAFDLIATCTSL